MGFSFLIRRSFPASFAGDVDPDKAAFMADSQVPWGVDALGGEIAEAAWRSKPSWYLVTTEDRMIPPDAQRTMAWRAGATVTETDASHSVYVSQPVAVAGIIPRRSRAPGSSTARQRPEKIAAAGGDDITARQPLARQFRDALGRGRVPTGLSLLADSLAQRLIEGSGQEVEQHHS